MWRIIDTPESSNIRKIAYNPVTKKLRVVFENDSAYEYSDVPQIIAGAFFTAESVGSYFAKNIRNGFAYVKYKGGTIDQAEVTPV